MNTIKTYLNGLGRGTRALILTLAVVFVSAGIAQAATTISTNISTGGTLSVTGLATLLGGATTTQMTLLSGDTIKNAAASTTIMSGVVQATGGVVAQASSTVVGNFTTTGNAAVTGTATVTGATTLGVTTSASTTATSFKIGQVGTQMTQVVSGYCATAASAINASTTTMLTCTPSAGASLLDATDRVMVMATSSLPGRVFLSSASSTAAGTIQVNAFNTGIDGGTVSSAVYAFNFWAFR